MTPHARLQLRDLHYSLKIGVGDEERSRGQDIAVSVELRFSALPGACRTEKIDETVCYDTLSKRIDRVVHAKTYLLIETLGFDVFTELHKELPEGTLLGVSVTKVKPPIAALQGGAVFSIADWEQSS